jgi:hypothetical protein
LLYYSPVAGRPAVPQEVRDEWTRQLQAATRDLHQARRRYRQTIRAAFAAGLSAPPIAAAVQLSENRVKQINKETE